MNIFIHKIFEDYYQKWPLVLVDVGSSGGIKDVWRKAIPHLRVIGFEPDERGASSPKQSSDSHVQYLDVGLSGQSGTVDFYWTRQQDASSVLKPNMDFLKRFGKRDNFEITEVKRISVDTLDSQLAKQRSKPDFLKIDTQGSELDVLKGSVKALETSVLGLEIEVNFAKRYEGQAFFSDIDAFVRGYGFELFDLERRFWKRIAGVRCGGAKGQLTHGNALYLRNITVLRAMMSDEKDEAVKKIIVLKMMSIVILYGYLDYAFELFDSFRDALTKQEQQYFLESIRKEVSWSQKLPNFRGRYKLYRLGNTISKFFKPVSRLGNTGDDALGNF